MPMPPPNQENFKELASEPERGPYVMLNLLKFKSRASTEGGDVGDSSGQQSYARYTEEARKQVERRGGKLLWSGRVRFPLIGSASTEMR